jgi:glycosyltransferase involved in cell wall biosynthesis
VRFSLIYPTRNRPAFVKVALKFLEFQDFDDFEVIVCDNYSDISFSCEKQCKESNLKNLKYVRAPKELSMSDNWNYALKFANGDYVAFFTDKTFMLPKFLPKLNKSLDFGEWDIINWTGNYYNPVSFDDYFGKGHYFKAKHTISKDFFSIFSPIDELNLKGNALISREEQNDSQYCRGKIVFGCYSSKLISKIIFKTGKLFHDISPDYTSMILALSYAESAIEINTPGVVQIHTDLSNGSITRTSEKAMLGFINTLSVSSNILTNLLVPNIYASQHNIVAHDYFQLKKKYKLSFNFKIENWLVYIWEDLNRIERKWDNFENKKIQNKNFNNYFLNEINFVQKIEFLMLLLKRYILQIKKTPILIAKFLYHKLNINIKEKLKFILYKKLDEKKSIFDLIEI